LAPRAINTEREKFKRERAMLTQYTDKQIAEKMGIDPANYSNVINGSKPMTDRFLNKFYDGCKDDLREKYTQIYKDDQTYKTSGIKGETLGQKVKKLENLSFRLMESHGLITDAIHRLEDKIDHILAIRLEEIEKVLARLEAGIESLVLQDPKDKGKEKPEIVKTTTKRRSRKEAPPKGASGKEESSK
jgi:transcriptional regulator with XRE-family HTH domain